MRWLGASTQPAHPTTSSLHALSSTAARYRARLAAPNLPALLHPTAEGCALAPPRRVSGAGAAPLLWQATAAAQRAESRRAADALHNGHWKTSNMPVPPASSWGSTHLLPEGACGWSDVGQGAGEARPRCRGVPPSVMWVLPVRCSIVKACACVAMGCRSAGVSASLPSYNGSGGSGGGRAAAVSNRRAPLARAGIRLRLQRRARVARWPKPTPASVRRLGKRGIRVAGARKGSVPLRSRGTRTMPGLCGRGGKGWGAPCRGARRQVSCCSAAAASDASGNHLPGASPYAGPCRAC